MERRGGGSTIRVVRKDGRVGEIKQKRSGCAVTLSGRVMLEEFPVGGRKAEKGGFNKRSSIFEQPGEIFKRGNWEGGGMSRDGE